MSAHARGLPQTPFGADDGGRDPALAAALHRAAEDPAYEPEVLRALHGTRVLVPVVARGGEDPEDHDRGTTMSAVTLLGADGRRALPVFSCLDELAAWDAAARPVPVPVAHAALAAAQSGADLLVLDVASARPRTYDGPVLRRLAEDSAILPVYDDPAVAQDLAALLASVPGVRAAWLVPAEGLDARLLLDLAPDVAAAAVDRLGPLLAGSAPLRAATVRGIDVRLVPAGERPTRPPLFAGRFLD